MNMFTRAAVVLFLVYLITATTSNGNSSMSCLENERQALLRFKNDLTDYSGRLSSWNIVHNDCCYWAGVVCHSFNGHVFELHLQNGDCNPSNSDHSYGDPETYMACEKNKLGGKINPSLLNLEQLSYLDLSHNDFGQIQIPSFISSLRTLRYLNLSDAGFSGLIPPGLGNLSDLRTLDLGGSYNFLRAENFRWLSDLFFLQHLDLSSANLSQASDWLQATNMLPSLVDLRLSFCHLDLSVSLPNMVNFTRLATLDISYNLPFPSSLLSNWLSSLTGLCFLNLRGCDISGPIPSGLENMTSLTHVDLSDNNLSSSIPHWLYHFRGLNILNLRFNHLRGSISDDIGNMTSIISIDMSSNELEGRIPRSIQKLCSLEAINLAGNRLSDTSDVLQMFFGCGVHSLRELSLRNCSISGPLPKSLGRLSSLESLDLADNQFNGTLPESIGQLSKLEELVIYSNTLEGVVSEVHFANLSNLRVLHGDDNPLILQVGAKWSPPFQIEMLRLRSWHWVSKFPNWLQEQQRLTELDLSATRISDIVPTWFWNLSSPFDYLNLSYNQLHGVIPSIPKVDRLSVIYLNNNRFRGSLPGVSANVTELDLSRNWFTGGLSHFLCGSTDKPNQLEILNLGDNLLSGDIPDCWMNWPLLRVVTLGNNNFKGNIPSSMGYLSYLQSLHLRNNSLNGEVPVTLQNCTELVIIDLSENEFCGSTTSWMGKGLLKLISLDLRSNKFSGQIPSDICHLHSLQILDLANNILSGEIPRCMGNFTAMATEISNGGQISNGGELTYSRHRGGFLEDAYVVTKGSELQYDATLLLVTSMDLSSNNLSGEIPKELTGLVGLRSLNLSGNCLTGMIPKKIDDMELLESLDLSRNQLLGEIPSSISSLTFLSHLNLSFNNLSGRIPSSTQLQSFDASCFIGNKLCGPPVSKNCTVDGIMPDNRNEEGKGDRPEVDWFYLCMALGFAAGFWVVCGPVMFIQSWRHVYFHFLEITWCRLRKTLIEDNTARGRRNALHTICCSPAPVHQFSRDCCCCFSREGREARDCCSSSLVGRSSAAVRCFSREARDCCSSSRILQAASPLGILCTMIAVTGQELSAIASMAMSSNSSSRTRTAIATVILIIHMQAVRLREPVRRTKLGGKMNLSLLNLEQLSYLDLSHNDFGGIQIPSFISYLRTLRWLSSLTGLRFLNLQCCGLPGPVPSALQNMTIYPTGCTILEVLIHSTFVTTIYEVPSQRTLDMTSIISIDMSMNELEGRIPRSIQKLCSLEAINLADSLHDLDLRSSSISGPLPRSLGRLSSLKSLNLAANQFNGTLPESIGQLSKFEGLWISYNMLEGVVSEVHFANLSNLRVFHGADNPLILQVSPKWSPPFQLEILGLRSWHWGPKFPNWLQAQQRLTYLDLSSTGISDIVSTWFWNLSSQFFYLNLSHNQLHGVIPFMQKVELTYSMMYLSHNRFSGSLPRLSANVHELDLSQNWFTGSLSNFLCGNTETKSIRNPSFGRKSFIRRYSRLLDELAIAESCNTGKQQF
ncbi:hypothetical protein RJ639_030391 [Escallonia herrerae]|uniref:Leucine-rich repeat-containing N-terminal plant-type domain-containing protein n=1 Tax=Escallonia herrerae TaxID=1293975 RepID=A0AA88X1T2_9ASTE|nr:hypothetical protein RJ639_030391 [Escallonia herrerae]